MNEMVGIMVKSEYSFTVSIVVFEILLGYARHCVMFC